MAKAAGLPPATIHLRKGHRGFGLADIVEGHLRKITNYGFKSAEDFVSTVGRGYDQLRRMDDGRIAVIPRRVVDEVLVVELKPDGGRNTDYNVITAYPTRVFRESTVLWDAARTRSPSAGTAPFADQRPRTSGGAPANAQGQNTTSDIGEPRQADKGDAKFQTPRLRLFFRDLRYRCQRGRPKIAQVLT